MRRLTGILILLLAGWCFGQNVTELRKKAENGDTKAMMELSEQYRFGFGVSQNEDSANYFVRAAADLDHPGAQFLIGNEKVGKVYAPKTYASGMNWLKKAAENGSVNAMLRLKEIYLERNTGTQSDQYYSPKKGFEYAEMAANKGNAEGALYCAEIYLNPKKSPTSDSLGLKWAVFAAKDRKFPPAQLFLGGLYADGKVEGKRDMGQAVYWYKQCMTNRRATQEDKKLADFALFDADQDLKMVHNQMSGLLWFLPEGEGTYRLREK